MRPTTKRRLLTLTLILLVLFGAIGGIFAYRISVINARIQQERVDGMAAYQAGDYDNALGLLSDYVGKHKDDGDALYALAVTRSQVSQPNGHHLTDAISFLNNYLDLRKGDPQGQHKLLELYSRVRWNPEILSLSDEILQRDPNDLPALRAKTAALMACASSIGAQLADAPLETVAALQTYGRELGLAFQLVDDLLGIWGSSKTTGKPVGADLRARKKSLPVVAAMASGTSAGEELRHLYESGDLHADCDDAVVAHAASLVDVAGGRAWVSDEAERRLTAAIGALGAAQLRSAPREALADVARYVTARDR